MLVNILSRCRILFTWVSDSSAIWRAQETALVAVTTALMLLLNGVIVVHICFQLDLRRIFSRVVSLDHILKKVNEILLR